MDNLVQTLGTLADPDDINNGWEVTNNGAAITVQANSSASFDNPDVAYAEARRMLAELTADGSHRLVNLAEVGAIVQPIIDEPRWRGRIKVQLWAADGLAEHHHIIEVSEQHGG